MVWVTYRYTINYWVLVYVYMYICMCYVLCVRIHVHLYVSCSLWAPSIFACNESSRSVFLYHSYKRSHGGEAAMKRLALCRLTWEQCSCGVAVQARVHVLPLSVHKKGSVLASVDVHHVHVQCIVRHVHVQCIVRHVHVQCIVRHVHVQCIVRPVHVQCIVRPVHVQCIVRPVHIQCIVRDVYAPVHVGGTDHC